MKKIKTNSKGECIIHPVVERLYTKDEVKNIASTALYAGYANGSLTSNNFQALHNVWLQQNL